MKPVRRPGDPACPGHRADDPCHRASMLSERAGQVKRVLARPRRRAQGRFSARTFEETLGFRIEAGEHLGGGGL
jgi:hypothetical protein